MTQLYLYNTLSRKKELFQAIAPPRVGMYVCGPTVYSDPHIGNARPAIVFDVLFRYLQYLGYQVRYVRNITDVGHLVDDADEGEDKISKKAKLEQKEPMEVVQTYTLKYRQLMQQLNVLPPSIEPTATGHILEQIESAQKILKQGLAYEANGSIYLDMERFKQMYPSYGELSGRISEDLIAGAGNRENRTLEGQDEKKHPADFALWKKAAPEHLMRWNSPWGEGFPGWHLECTVMSTKYLGETFDIHGGGMDLMFPHHECEIAQAKALHGKAPVNYWMHNNMITQDGRKMSKQLGNVVNIEGLMRGEHPIVEKDEAGNAKAAPEVYSPMTVRLVILQTQYRSTLDLTFSSLKNAKITYKKLLNGKKILQKLAHSSTSAPDPKTEQEIERILSNIFEALNDDLNTALAITHLLELVKKINIFFTQPDKLAQISEELLHKIQQIYQEVFSDILGLLEEKPDGFDSLLESLLEQYKEAKANKAYDKVDAFRAEFKKIGILVKDMKSGIDWAYDEV